MVELLMFLDAGLLQVILFQEGFLKLIPHRDSPSVNTTFIICPPNLCVLL